MNVKELHQKTDAELTAAYSFLKTFICENLEITPEEFESDVNSYLNQHTYKARKLVKMVRIAIAELESIFSTLHIQVTEETLIWSSMEDTRFNTTDRDGIGRVIQQAFNN